MTPRTQANMRLPEGFIIADYDCGFTRCTVLCCAVLCCSVLCCAVLCCAVLCCGVVCAFLWFLLRFLVSPRSFAFPCFASLHVLSHCLLNVSPCVTSFSFAFPCFTLPSLAFSCFTLWRIIFKKNRASRSLIETGSYLVIFLFFFQLFFR